MTPQDRDFLTSLFDAAIAAADPKRAIAAHLPKRPKGRVVVIGAGKGAAQMARAFEELWDGPISGCVVTRYGFGAKTTHIRVLEAAHPVPDLAGIDASAALFAAVDGLGPDDLVVALISGGGSALLACPADGLIFADEVALAEVLLASGAPIGAMNAIRKMTSGIKGGRLAAAVAPAKIISLIVSDVPGDDPGEVASGPTVFEGAPGGGRAAALAAVRDFAIDLPERIAAHLQHADDLPTGNNDAVHIIASAATSLDAAARIVRAAGIDAAILSDAIEGEARDVARMHAAMAREIARKERPFSTPVVMLSGGETTVTLRGNGRGGRNAEFLLAFAIGIEGEDRIFALAADTDGIDGSQDNAGAFADGGSCARMRAAGIDPAQALANNDAYSAFEAIGDLFMTGPTGTNVNDLRAVYIR